MKVTPHLTMITTGQGCPHCVRMETLLNSGELYPTKVNAEDILPLFSKVHSTVPQLYYKGKHLGGADALQAASKTKGDLLEYVTGVPF